VYFSFGKKTLSRLEILSVRRELPHDGFLIDSFERFDGFGPGGPVFGGQSSGRDFCPGGNVRPGLALRDRVAPNCFSLHARRLNLDILCGLVIADANKNGLPQATIRGPFAELHFYHDFRLDPMSLLTGLWGFFKR